MHPKLSVGLGFLISVRLREERERERDGEGYLVKKNTKDGENTKDGGGSTN